jgi:2-dehydropantoate 2-reductase
VSRYLVIGCGAIGGTVAAGLARDGHEVLVSDADLDAVDAIRARGITITGPVEEFTARVTAVSPQELPAVIDCPVLLAVKAHHTATAAAALAGRLTDDAFVVSLQNGLNAGPLTEAVGPGRVVEACVNFGADVLEPGVVLRGNRATFVIGEIDGSVSDRVRSVAADIADAQASADVLGYIWSKEAYGAMLAATAVSDLPIADALDDPAFRPLLTGLARQVLAQAPVPPRPLDGFDPDDLDGSLARLAEFNRGSAKTHSGIYRDLAVLHRPTEMPAILGPLAGPGAPLVSRVLELIAAIEAGRRTCSLANLELLAAYERLERLGRPLNAVAAVIGAPERAQSGALAGVPVAVKDIIAIEGVPTRCGSPASDEAPAAQDATLVARLRAAGAEVFAASQCLEYAAGFAHPLIGDTRNPRDPSRTSGGSSGGSAALVAAGVCDLAIGTDTGGSIRIPAAYCGIVGLKPSYGLVPVDGVFPLAGSCDHAGTLTATVAGTARLLAVLAGQPGLAGALAVDDSESRPLGFRVGLLTAQLTDPSVTPQVGAAVGAAIEALTAAGWRVTEISAPWLEQLPRWEETLAVIVARQAHLVHAGRDTSRFAEGTRALLEFGSAVTGDRFAQALAEQAELAASVTESLDGVDVLAGPTVGFEAPEKDPPFGLGDGNAESRFTGPYNLSGHPAISVPLPGPGLPAGLQLAGRRGDDAGLLRAAAAAERALAANRS